MPEFKIRRGARSDARGFLSLLQALAKFERLDPPDTSARRRILNDVFSRKRINLLVASAGGSLVGYALYFFSYSSFLAKPNLYLEDLFVLEEARGKGIGKALFMACVKEAARKRCGRMEWAVLTWNHRAIDFYEETGARRLDDWHHFRLEEEVIERLSRVRK